MAKQPWFWAVGLSVLASLPANAQVIRGVISLDNARSSC